MTGYIPLTIHIPFQINPSDSCAESEKFSNGEPSGCSQYDCGLTEKPPPCFVINTKGPPVRSAPVVAHRPQPAPQISDSFQKLSTDDSKQIEAFSATQPYSGLNNNNVEKVTDRERRIPSYHEAVKHRDPAPKINPPPAKKFVIQASTSELLRCLGEYVCSKCKYASSLEASDVISWLRGVDRSLLAQGWQDISFIMPSSVVFVYMLCRDALSENLMSAYEVRTTVLTCLYLSYSYMGNEISYPLRPFLVESSRNAFWDRCCRIMNKSSGKMLRINRDSQYFTSVFRELKSYGPDQRQPIVKPQSLSRHSVHHSRARNSDYMQHPNHSGRSAGGKVAMTAGGY